MPLLLGRLLLKGIIRLPALRKQTTGVGGAVLYRGRNVANVMLLKVVNPCRGVYVRVKATLEFTDTFEVHAWAGLVYGMVLVIVRRQLLLLLAKL